LEDTSKGFEVKIERALLGDNSFGRLLNFTRSRAFFLPIPKRKEIIPINEVVFHLPNIISCILFTSLGHFNATV
jgi:hypothetical protein